MKRLDTFPAIVGQSLATRNELEVHHSGLELLESLRKITANFSSLLCEAQRLIGGQRLLANQINVKESTLREWKSQKRSPNIRNMERISATLVASFDPSKASKQGNTSSRAGCPKGKRSDAPKSGARP